MMDTNKRICTTVILSVIIIYFAAVSSCFAGTGKLESGKFNFGISLRFDATAAQLLILKQQFQDASELLFDVTDGQLQFGEIFVCDDKHAGRSAEYWIYPPGNGRSNAPGKYGKAGDHINQYWDDCVGTTASNVDRAMTLVHEFIHHTFGPRDEYSGPGGGSPECVDSSGAVTQANKTACIMDNYWTKGTVDADGFTLTEMCCGTSTASFKHDADNDTWQESVNSESCWDTTKKRLGASITKKCSPTDAKPAGAATITWTELEPERRIILIVDRSGSMGGSRMAIAIAGAQRFVDLARTGDKIGVVSYSSSASVDFALTEITGAATKTAAKAAIAGLVASGLTNIGGGLQTALGLITAQPKRACEQVFVLMSDGFHNTGTDPASVIPGLKANGVIVHTIGVGASVDTALLSSIATQTGGIFRQAVSAAAMGNIWNVLAAEVKEAGILNLAPGTSQPGETDEVDIFVDDKTTQAIFSVVWGDSTADLDLTLRDPSGNVITPGVAATDPNIDFISDSTSELYIVNTPLQGTWKMMIKGVSIPFTSESYIAQADSDAVDVKAVLTPDATDVTFPDAVRLESQAISGTNLVGLTLMGEVTRPDGSTVTFEFFDDGDPAHGDVIAGDGIFSALFDSYKANGNGTYSFELTVDNTAGTAYRVPGETLFENPPDTSPVSPFKRVASASVVVQGVPLVIPLTKDELFVDAGRTLGIWTTPDGTNWTRFADTNNPAIDVGAIASGDMDGNLKDELFVDAGRTLGIWTSPDGTNWTRLKATNLEPDATGAIALGDMDGNGRDELYVDLGHTSGIWTSPDGTTWTKFADTNNPAIDVGSIALGDMDGDGSDELFVDLGRTLGIWTTPDGTNWTRLKDTSQEPDATGAIALGDMDGDGRDELYVDLGHTSGIWTTPFGFTWTKLADTNSPAFDIGAITTGDMDADGSDELFVDAGHTLGIWTTPDGTNWTKFADTNNPAIDVGIIVTGDMDGL